MPELYFLPDLEARGLPKAHAERLVRAGKKVRGVWMVTLEDLIAEYANIDRGVEDSQNRPDRVERDDNPTGRSAKESVGLGKHPRRSRKAVQKPSLRIVDTGAEDLDVSEVRK